MHHYFCFRFIIYILLNVKRYIIQYDLNMHYKSYIEKYNRIRSNYNIAIMYYILTYYLRKTARYCINKKNRSILKSQNYPRELHILNAKKKDDFKNKLFTLSKTSRKK